MPHSETGCGYAQICPSERSESGWAGGAHWARAEVPEEAVGAVSVSPKKQSWRVAGAGCVAGWGMPVRQWETTGRGAGSCRDNESVVGSH